MLTLFPYCGERVFVKWSDVTCRGTGSTLCPGNEWRITMTMRGGVGGIVDGDGW